MFFNVEKNLFSSFTIIHKSKFYCYIYHLRQLFGSVFNHIQLVTSILFFYASDEIIKSTYTITPLKTFKHRRVFVST